MNRGAGNGGPVLVVGANGQLGREIVNALHGRQVSVIAACRDPATADVVLDLAFPDRIANVVEQTGAGVVVNAAAYTAVDRAEQDSALARTINADAPGVLAAACRERGALLVHFSTDYVFDGMLGRPYREGDDARPVNEYGRGKLAGERAIASSGAAHLVFRTSGLYTPGGQNFVATMLRLFRGDRPVQVVTDQWSAPTCARHLAGAVVDLLARSGARVDRGLSGVYHLCAGGEASWHEFAAAIYERAMPPPAATLGTTTSDAFGAAARRPRRSTLDCGLARDRLGLTLPHWLAQLDSVMPEFNALAAQHGK